MRRKPYKLSLSEAALFNIIAGKGVIPLSNFQQFKTDMGEVSIANEVLAFIATEAARGVHGVVNIAGNLMDDLAKTLKQERRGVNIRLENETLIVELHLVVLYGVPIYEIAENVQKEVKKAIEGLTKLTVTAVNVFVRSVKVVENEPSE